MVSLNFISPITNSCKSVYNRIPSAVIAKNKVIDRVAYIGQKWTSPHQRAIMGLTAIVMQPVIDWKNKNVDEKTRKVSVARTFAKIIAGTATGVALRYGFIKGIKALSRPASEIPKDAKPFVKKLMHSLTPNNLNPNDKDALEQYRNAMGTILSLVAMVFTNFLIDAPLTKFLTNKFIALQEKGEHK